MSLGIMMEFKRTKQFARNEKLESLLRHINNILGPVEERVIDSYRMPKYPVVLIVGAPRCGSTLMMQWLAQTDIFAYPTNLLSRFYGAPYIGALIQKLLIDPEFDFNNEFFDFSSEMSFDSDLGKSRGILAPNEFWYFWRRFFPYGEIHYLDEESLAKVDAERFVAELAAIESVFDKPLAMKGLIINWNIPYVSNLLDQILFIYITRHPLYNAQSLLEARVKYYGDRRGWYSFKPREYAELKKLDPLEQVAAQVYFTNKSLNQDLGEIDRARWLQVSYEDFCESPGKVFRQIIEKLENQGMEIGNWEYEGPKNFEPTNQIRLPEEECRLIIAAYKRFSGTDFTI
jgi:hypothetical protein